MYDYALNKQGIAEIVKGRTFENKRSGNSDLSPIEFIKDQRNNDPLLRTITTSRKRYFKESDYCIYGNSKGRKR